MHISRNSFDRLVEQAIAALPPQYAQWLDQLPIIVEDHPPKSHPNTLGLYQGIPLPDQEQNSGHLPSRILLFRQPLMQACHSQPQLAEEIRKTLLHELGHHTGMNEVQLDHLGYGPLEDPEDEIQWDLDDD